ncbi:hypothetical protein [Methylobacterium longum]|uniref:Uncharacterized protein n=1 Tax=Methylobacterium longum TaxID=767694 RepID=A0ABT8APR2_9HYPH|nr:hypothetical protein [Methylobacterium longum]MDN3571789.1 hypothetical protein [Methylobacterium longum]
MLRWFQFILGLVTLCALGVGAVRPIMRYGPAGFQRWAYEALVVLLACSFVNIALRAAWGYRAPKSD